VENLNNEGELLEINYQSETQQVQIELAAINQAYKSPKDA